MRKTYLVLTAVYLSVLLGEAGAAIVALHENAADPLNEGWKKIRPFTNISTFPVTNDLGLGIDAWAVDDNGVNGGSEGLYFTSVTAQQINNATVNGWKLTTRLRLFDTPPGNSSSTYVGFQTNDTSYGMSFAHDQFGSPMFRLGGTSEFVDLGDLDSGYHLYEFLYNVSETNVDLFVDEININVLFT